MRNIYWNWSAAQSDVTLVGLGCCWWSRMAGIHSAVQLWMQGHGSRWTDKEHAEKIKKTEIRHDYDWVLSIYRLASIVSERSCTLDALPTSPTLCSKPRPSFGLQHSRIACRIQGIPSDSGFWKEGERCDSWWFPSLEMSSRDHVPRLPCEQAWLFCNMDSDEHYS